MEGCSQPTLGKGGGMGVGSACTGEGGWGVVSTQRGGIGVWSAQVPFSSLREVYYFPLQFKEEVFATP